MQDKGFVHLHLHTDYSLLDGAIQIKPLAERTEKPAMNACAMTDHGNMYGAITFYNTMKARGIKPIIGCETYLALGNRKDRAGASAPGEKRNHHLILLAKDFEGYRVYVDSLGRHAPLSARDAAAIDSELRGREGSPSHVMETATFLTDHADLDVRDRLPPLAGGRSRLDLDVAPHTEEDHEAAPDGRNRVSVNRDGRAAHPLDQGPHGRTV